MHAVRTTILITPSQHHTPDAICRQFGTTACRGKTCAVRCSGTARLLNEAAFGRRSSRALEIKKVADLEIAILEYWALHGTQLCAQAAVSASNAGKRGILTIRLIVIQKTGAVALYEYIHIGKALQKGMSLPVLLLFSGFAFCRWTIRVAHSQRRLGGRMLPAGPCVSFGSV